MADSDTSVRTIDSGELRDVPLGTDSPEPAVATRPGADSALESQAVPDSTADAQVAPAQPGAEPHGFDGAFKSAGAVSEDLRTPGSPRAADRSAPTTEAQPRTSIASNRPSSLDVQRSRSSSLRRGNHSSVALEHSSVNGAVSQPAVVMIKNAFKKISQSKEAKRIPALQQATARALDEFERRPNTLPSAKLVLEPLRLVSMPGSTSSELKEVAIDTLGQVFALNYLASQDEAAEEALLEDAVGIVCDAWDAEGADQRIELQIIKALTAAVVNEDVVAHGAVLLRAVRRMYNIFLVTRSVDNQALAQVSLTQMVQAVFERVKQLAMSVPLPAASPDSKDAAEPGLAGDQGQGNATSDATNLTLDDMKDTAALPDLGDSEVATQGDIEKATQDAGLVFRTLCKLSVKQDIDEKDVRSQPMRSKLLSLHLLHLVLKHHISVFKDPRVLVRLKNDNVGFAYAVKPYLRLTMAQNALSSAASVFEITAEIFWLVLANLRSEFKSELAVLFTEVYFTAMEMRGATIHQRMYFMTVLSRICTDPRLLVELYLNYDCDPTAPDVYEKLIELVSRLAMRPVVEPQQPLARFSIDRQQVRVYDLNGSPTQAIAKLTQNPPASNADLDLYQLTMAALEAIVNSLRSLVLWSQRSEPQHSQQHLQQKQSISGSESTTTLTNGNGSAGHRPSSSQVSLASNDSDDPTQFASRKQTKRALDAAVQEFNFNPKKGLQKLVEINVLASLDDPVTIGKALFGIDGLDKTTLGNYLGHQDREATLEAFINAMNFRGKTFIAAMRELMQPFRMPGEGQVVNRIMKAFAHKYYEDTKVNDVHPDFANWEIAWSLASSAMILNTDLYTPHLRRRMSKEDYVKYNRGMNDGLDFRTEMLTQIYDEIRENEIKVESEQTSVAIQSEAYDIASDAITHRAAKYFQQSQPLEFTDYYNASHAEHIRPMFEQSWLAVLAAISSPFTQLKDPAVLSLCLDGLELALRIATHFDVALARQSLVQMLAQHTSLTNLANCTWKNIGAVRALLRVSLVEGDMIRDSWYDILVVVSKLEQAQLAARSRDPAIAADVAQALLSRELVLDIDRIFVQTRNMTPEGAVFFVQALSRVSLEEIDQSRDSPEPRVFALQKMVDVCYYNSDRIRMGWSELWDAAMAEQFTKVLVDPNPTVVAFALDSLRQLSMSFLEIDELPHFAFQSEFLKPFVHALKHNKNPQIQVLVLECFKQMVLVCAGNLRSGWKTIFGAVEVAASSVTVVLDAAYALLLAVPTANEVPPHFLGACVALAEQADVRIALHAAELMHQLVESHPGNMELWQQLFVELSKIAMRGKDLEVRGRCLDIIFSVLSSHGKKFQREDWDTVFEQSIGPLFNVLHGQTKPAPHSHGLEHGSDGHRLSVPDQESSQDLQALPSRSPSPSRSRSPNGKEEHSLWLSSTLIQALKSLTALLNQFFDMLEHALEPFFLQLMRTCILQENDPVSRTGTACLQKLVQDNAAQFTAEHWRLVTDVFVQLFQDTTATTLMDREALKNPEPNVRHLFQSTVAKTVQMLLIIEAMRELLVNSGAVFDRIPIKEILRLTTRLLMSYSFARDFNMDQPLRHELYERRIVQRLPNLLLQESLAAQTYVSISMRLFRSVDRFSEDPSARQDLSDELMRVCSQILSDYNQLTQNDQRYINKLMPILESVLRHVSHFDDNDFRHLIPSIYLQVIDVLNKEMPRRLREEVQSILRRMADVWMKPRQNGEKHEVESVEAVEVPEAVAAAPVQAGK